MRSGRVDRHSEAGTTLIELLVAVAIMGIAFVTILGGIGTAIIGAGSQRAGANAGLVLTSAAEKVLAETDVPYQACASDYPAPTPPSGSSGFIVTVTGVAFWDPTPNRFVDKASLSTCTPADPTDLAKDNGLQLITLSLRSVSGAKVAKSETLDVVKRKAE